MSRIIAVVLPFVVLIIIGIAGSSWLEANKPEPEASTEERQALTVLAERIERRDLTLSITAQGEVRPRSEISVTPQVAGRISYISSEFVDGGYIPKGRIIARLDQADYELAVVRANAGIAAAEQGLAREQAEAELAVRDIEELGIAESSPLARREPQLAEAQASLDSAKAQLREAELALDRTIIRAPFNSRVREKAADIGQFVGIGQNLGRIFSTDTAEVSLPLSDAQLGELGLPLAYTATSEAPGPQVIFTATVGGKMREWVGEVTRTSAAVNSQSRLINVIAEVDDPYGKGSDDGAPMAPGLFVTATIGGETIEDALWAPRSALRGDNSLFIGDQSAGLLNIRSVELLHTDENGAYFRDGPAQIGELAIVSPVQAAFDGMRLLIRERRSDGSIVAETTENGGGDQAAAALTSSEATETSQ